MQRHVLEYFRCPLCKGHDLELVDSTCSGGPGEIVDGSLRCIACGETYLIAGGLPRFVSKVDYTGTFGFQWNLFRRTQLDSYTGLPISRSRLSSATQWPTSLRGETILEAGSGAGRFTEILLESGATVFSFDASESVDANAVNHPNHPNLHLFQASIFGMPLRDRMFDKVLCLGCLQHTPDPEAAFRCLARHVKPGGELVVDVYAKRLRALLCWKYALRPLTAKMTPETLFRVVKSAVPRLAPIAATLRKVLGPAGARMMPVLEYSHLGLPREIALEWAVLDTFDMYSPAYDRPQSIEAVRRWFADSRFEEVHVSYGPNGIVGRGRASATMDGSRFSGTKQ